MKIRKKMSTVIMILSLSLLCSFSSGCDDNKDKANSKRFEPVHTESYEYDSSTDVNDIEVWRDKETGKEYVCFMIRRSGSCVETKSSNNSEHKEKE